ncbi:uncharacterized protein BDZ99DRAFT_567213 [Mytilinidion resinicola]|uniref:Uncharacterized protein n=1 Tax=Mytilinidion resinicola TaxID=574789 RepID=A0A6A6Z2G6_9PEZI|nr:uncharacterized protein BDZ99DRAFT_567213 [Mytilinidion resinicola]KAF2815352.1 hypothetical protein BDZ99DRAFT_567213 [Mytilinidion resinicola]
MADTLPAELVEEVFRSMEEHVPNERIDILTAESVQAIKNARLQCQFWSQAAWRTFARLVGQVPFFATKISMAKLENLNLHFMNPVLDLDDPPTKDFMVCHAKQITYITGNRPYSFSALNLTSKFEEDLAQILPRFSNLKNLRYIPTVEGHLRGYRWARSRRVSSQGLYIPEGTEDYQPLILDRIAKVLLHNNVRLESFSSPFKGKINPLRDALPASLFAFYAPGQPLARMLNSVQSLAINLRLEDEDSSHAGLEASNIGNLLQSLHNLQVLELACSNTSDAEPLWDQLVRIADLAESPTPAPIPLASLSELRISFTATNRVDGELMVTALRTLPNLRRLSLGYVNLADEVEWDEVFELFDAFLALDKLLLVEPLQFGAPSKMNWNSLGRGYEYPALEEAAGVAAGGGVGV